MGDMRHLTLGKDRGHEGCTRNPSPYGYRQEFRVCIVCASLMVNAVVTTTARRYAASDATGGYQFKSDTINQFNKEHSS